jgi:hypothetical protein
MFILASPSSFVCDGGEAAIDPNNDQCPTGDPELRCQDGYVLVQDKGKPKCQKA